MKKSLVQKEEILDISTLTSGVYLVNITSIETNYTKTIIKK